MVKDKVVRPHGEFRVSKSTECDTFSFSALTVLVRRQEDHPACKKCWYAGCDELTGELCTSDNCSCLHHFTILRSNKIQNGVILVPAFLAILENGFQVGFLCCFLSFCYDWPDFSGHCASGQIPQESL